MNRAITLAAPGEFVRRCLASRADGSACGMPPRRSAEYCFAHDPAAAAEAAKARQLDGLRRRREKAVATIYELDGLVSLAGAGRLLEIVTSDTLELPNSIARSRMLTFVAGTI